MACGKIRILRRNVINESWIWSESEMHVGKSNLKQKIIFSFNAILDATDKLYLNFLIFKEHRLHLEWKPGVHSRNKSESRPTMFIVVWKTSWSSNLQRAIMGWWGNKYNLCTTPQIIVSNSWLFQTEYSVVVFDAEKRQVKLSLSMHEVLERIREAEMEKK